MNIAVADFGSAKRCAIACALQQSHAADWTGVFRRIIHDFADWDGFFFLLVSFVFCFFFSISISLFFFFLERDCLLCAICDTWLRACCLLSLFFLKHGFPFLSFLSFFLFWQKRQASKDTDGSLNWNRLEKQMEV